MRWRVDGFEWDVKFPQRHTRAQAELAVRGISRLGRNSSHAREADAALSVCDWDHAVDCAEAANEWADACAYDAATVTPESEDA